MIKRGLWWQIATLGPVGQLPAPGTCGSLVTVLFAFFLTWYTSVEEYWIVLAGITIIGFFVVDRVQKQYGVRDPKQIVIDEVIGMLIAVIALPLRWEWFVVGFLLFRFFDILKPWIIRTAEFLPGPFGVICDDVLAGLAARILIAAVLYIDAWTCIL